MAPPPPPNPTSIGSKHSNTRRFAAPKSNYSASLTSNDDTFYSYQGSVSANSLNLSPLIGNNPSGKGPVGEDVKPAKRSLWSTLKRSMPLRADRSPSQQSYARANEKFYFSSYCADSHDSFDSPSKQPRSWSDSFPFKQTITMDGGGCPMPFNHASPPRKSYPLKSAMKKTMSGFAPPASGDPHTMYGYSSPAFSSAHSPIPQVISTAAAPAPLPLFMGSSRYTASAKKVGTTAQASSMYSSDSSSDDATFASLSPPAFRWEPPRAERARSRHFYNSRNLSYYSASSDPAPSSDTLALEGGDPIITSGSIGWALPPTPPQAITTAASAVSPQPIATSPSEQPRSWISASAIKEETMAQGSSMYPARSQHDYGLESQKSFSKNEMFLHNSGSWSVFSSTVSEDEKTPSLAPPQDTTTSAASPHSIATFSSEQPHSLSSLDSEKWGHDRGRAVSILRNCETIINAMPIAFP